MPAQPMSQPYYGYGHYTNGMTQPFSTPAPVSTYQATAPPAINHGSIQTGQPLGATTLPRANAVPHVLGPSAQPNDSGPSSNGVERLKNGPLEQASVNSPVEILDSPRRFPLVGGAGAEKFAVSQTTGHNVEVPHQDALGPGVSGISQIDDSKTTQESPATRRVRSLSRGSVSSEEVPDTGMV